MKKSSRSVITKRIIRHMFEYKCITTSPQWIARQRRLMQEKVLRAMEIARLFQ
jgi:hypothetical protein